MPAARESDPEDVGTINLAPRSPALNATHLNWLIERYIEACRWRLDHQYTVDGYEYQLLWFQKWWQVEGPPRAWLLRPDDFVRFEKYLRSAISESTKRKLAYYTRATILKRIGEALRWAQDKGYVDRNYWKWLPRAHGGPPKRRAADIAMLARLLEMAEKGKYSIRNRAIVAMLMGMGLRREELSKIDREDVVIEPDGSGFAHVVGKRTIANPTGERDAAFDGATGAILIAYLNLTTRKTGPLLLSQTGERLSGQGIYHTVKKIIADAKLQSQIVGPHDLRRAFTTHYRRARKSKASAQLVKLQLGHSSISQTDEYTLLDVHDIRVDMVSPVALIASSGRNAITRQ